MTSGAARRLPVPVVRTVPVDDPGDLIACLPEPSGLAWVRGGEGIVGWGVAARVDLGTGPGRFAAAQDAFDELAAALDVEDGVGRPGGGLTGFASFTFDEGSTGSVLVVPRVVVGRRDGTAWVTTVDLPHVPRLLPRPVPALPDGVRFTGSTLDPADWRRAVARAVERIRAGSLRKVVLARDLHAVSDAPLDPRAILRRLHDRFPDCFTYAVDGLVGSTPELLVRRAGSSVRSLVLAGTAARGADAVTDAALGTGLLQSIKDRQEHELAVASVREVLVPRTGPLSLESGPHLLKLANLQHLATSISAELRDPTPVLELVGALHPTAAVCGTPRDRAVEAIRELEGMDRGRYSGPVGWLDAAGNGEFGIALRCAQVDGRSARLFAGNGIVAGSDPVAELTETEIKLAAMQGALGGTGREHERVLDGELPRHVQALGRPGR